MKEQTKNNAVKLLKTVTTAGIMISFLSAGAKAVPLLNTYIENAAVISTAISARKTPGEIAKIYNQENEEIDFSDTITFDDLEPEEEEPVPDKAEQKGVSSISSLDIPEENRRSVVTQTIGKKGANMSYENVFVKKLTKEHTIDIASLLSKKPDVPIKEGGEPQVLIMHTHTTESFMPYDIGAYDKTWETRTLDESKNIVKVGDEIAKQLNDAGIKTLHDKTVHDNPSYTGAYERSEVTVKGYLEKYPSIKVVLDIHRDAITYADGTKLKPTIEINGKNAAQIMLINGCEEGNVTEYPDWEINMRFSLALQKQVETDYPGLARPLYFAIKKYNQHLTHGSVLIEMGSEANTLEEAVYSGELLGKSLVKCLNALKT